MSYARLRRKLRSHPLASRGFLIYFPQSSQINANFYIIAIIYVCGVAHTLVGSPRFWRGAPDFLCQANRVRHLYADILFL